MVVDSGGLQQRAGCGGVGDELGVGVGVADEVLRRRVVDQLGDALVRGDDRYGVVQHRRAAIDPLVNRQQLAVTGHHAADAGSDQLDKGALGGRRPLQRPQHPNIGPFGEQHTDLASGKTLWPVGKDAQRRRRWEVGDRWPRRRGRVRERVEAQAVGDASGEVLVDVAEVGNHAGADAGLFALAQLEHEGVDDVLLLDRCLADVELAGLAVVVGEAQGADPLLGAVDRLGVAAVAADRILPWAAGLPAPRVGFVVDPPDRVDEGHVAVLLEVGDGALGRVDRQVGEVRAHRAA